MSATTCTLLLLPLPLLLQQRYFQDPLCCAEATSIYQAIGLHWNKVIAGGNREDDPFQPSYLFHERLLCVEYNSPDELLSGSPCVN